MIKHSLRAMLIALALCSCVTIGMLIGRSRTGHHLFASFSPDESFSTESTAEDTGKNGILDLNTATAYELAMLPGIGDSLAQRIITYREENGPFKHIEDIMNVEGIGQGRFDDISQFITVGG